MQTRIFQPTPYNIRRLAKVLVRGGLVAVPTETVYGLAADALNPVACQKIFEAKGRPSNDPLIVHIARKSQVELLAFWNEAAEALAAEFWPGALTLILPKSKRVSDVVTSGLDSVALRMPSHPVFRKLLRATNRPLAAPSANPFGYISPTTSQHVKDHLGGKISAILEGGACPVGVESTIVDLTTPTTPRILRPGSITKAQIEACLGRKVVLKTPGKAPKGPIQSPGQLDRHYSPKTPLCLHRRLPRHPAGDEAVVYFHAPPTAMQSEKNTFILSADGSGATAARNLFAILRQLDQGRWKKIHLELPPSNDPWHPALLDRLRRAASR